MTADGATKLPALDISLTCPRILLFLQRLGEVRRDNLALKEWPRSETGKRQYVNQVPSVASRVPNANTAIDNVDPDVS